MERRRSRVITWISLKSAAMTETPGAQELVERLRLQADEDWQRADQFPNYSKRRAVLLRLAANALEASERLVAKLTLERDEAREQFDRHVEWAANAVSDDLPWALERVQRLCASAYVDASVYRTKLLKGFGYPNETF